MGAVVRGRLSYNGSKYLGEKDEKEANVVLVKGLGAAPERGALLVGGIGSLGSLRGVAVDVIISLRR